MKKHIDLEVDEKKAREVLKHSGYYDAKLHLAVNEKIEEIEKDEDKRIALRYRYDMDYLDQHVRGFIDSNYGLRLNYSDAMTELELIDLKNEIIFFLSDKIDDYIETLTRKI